LLDELDDLQPESRIEAAMPASTPHVSKSLLVFMIYFSSSVGSLPGYALL
jgi:hypothetical protein